MQPRQEAGSLKFRAFTLGDPLPTTFGPAGSADGSTLNYYATVVD